MSMLLELSSHARRAFTAMAGDLERVFGDRMVALVAYAPARGAVFTTSIEAADLDALAVLTETWHKSGLETPLLLTSDEFRRSLDVFPLEYQAIMSHHSVISGTPPFADAKVDNDALRQACEAQAKGHLIHLRAAWLDAAGHSHDLQKKLVASAMPLRALLSHVAMLDGHADDDLAAYAGTRFSTDAETLRAVLALEHHPENAKALIPRLPQYLAACHHVWDFVDRWHA